jgi:hypothetical protein
MARVGFEPTIPVFKRAKTVHALDSHCDRRDWNLGPAKCRSEALEHEPAQSFIECNENTERRIQALGNRQST